MLKIIWDNPWLRAAAIVLAVLAALEAMYLLSFVLVPLFFAFIVAYIFDPVIDQIEKYRVARMTAIIGIVLITLTAAIVAPFLLLPRMASEAEALVRDQMDEARQTDIVDKTLERLPVRTALESLGQDVQPPEEFRARVEIAEYVKDFVQRDAGALLKEYGRDIASIGQAAGASAAGFFRNVANTVMAFVLFIGNFALYGFVAVYLLNDYDHIVRVARDLIPTKARPKAVQIFRDIDTNLKAFMRGQFVVVAFLGVIYMIGLSLSGTPFALTLSLFGAIANFIPYLGLILTIGPAVLLTLLAHGVDWHVLAVLATFAIAQGLEGNVVTPKIIGSQVGLSPVWVILAIMVFSSTLGFTGLLLAVPLAAVLKVLVVELIQWYKSTPLFDDAPAAETAPEPAAESE